jgi:hypothetical protein
METGSSYRRFARIMCVAAPAALLLSFLLPRLDWGFLSTAPGVPIVRTAELDEWHLVEGVLRMSLVPFRPDPLDRSWGDFSFLLQFATLSTCDMLGIFPGGFHTALLSGDLSLARPVLLAMRGLSVFAALVSVVAAFELARRRRGPVTGLLAAALVAVSPAVTLSGRTFVTDMLQTALVVLAFLPASPAAAGVLIGLAGATKYSALVFLPALAVSVAPERRRTLLWAVPLGFALGAPFVVRHAPSSAWLILQHVAGIYGATGASVAERLWAWSGHASNAAFYLVGPVGLVLAFRGVREHIRGAEGDRGGRPLTRSGVAVPLLLVLGQAAWLSVLAFPVVRYQLPLVPFLAAWVAEGVAASRLSWSGRAALVAATLGPPTMLSALLVFGVPRTHPFESTALFLRGTVRPEERVGRIGRDLPVLPGMQTERLSPFPNTGRPVEPPVQEFLVNSDLAGIDFAPAYVAGRNRNYRLLAAFGGPPRLLGLTWPRALTPQDVRYGCPRVEVWIRRGIRPADDALTQ